MPETAWATELDSVFNPARTAWALESNACRALGDTATQTLAAWTDGTFWLDHDGREVGWTDWPPPELVALMGQSR